MQVYQLTFHFFYHNFPFVQSSALSTAAKKQHQTVDGHKDLMKNFRTTEKAFISFAESSFYTKLRSSPIRISTAQSSFLLEFMLLSLERRFMKLVRLPRRGDNLC